MNASDKKPSKIAVTCAYAPVEIITAAGFTPIRVIPLPRPSEADPFIHPLTCGYIKGLLAAAMKNDLPEMAGIVIVNCCDGMRKLGDIWKNHVRIPVLMLDIPKKNDGLSIDFFASELSRFAGRIHQQMKSPSAVTRQNLAPAILFWNKIRRQVGEVFSEMLKSEMSGVQCQQYLDAMKMEPERMAEAVKKIAADIAGQTIGHNKIPVMVAASMFPDANLMNYIDQSGGCVAALDSCIGIRHFGELVEEKSEDPFHALAERYLKKPLCPRMIALSDRIDQFMGQIRSSGAAGVIMSTMKYCDTAMYEQMPLLHCVKESGIPNLLLENSYDGAMSEQEKNRIEAFFESLRKEV